MSQELATEEVAQLKQAIDDNDLERVRELMTRNPDLHGAPLGYGKNGPLTWAAECRVPYEPPTAERLAIAKWMLENGSDVHQGGDGPLMRAALRGDRIPMMELLVDYGADVNAAWAGWFPILFAPCESVDPEALEWLLRHGAHPGAALDYLLGGYVRSADVPLCIGLLREAGATTKYDFPGVLDIVEKRLDVLKQRLDADPELLHRQYAGLDIGSTGARRLLLEGATLLHVAAEFCNADAVRLLLDCGAAVDARAAVHGQTALFHAVSQFEDKGLEAARVLLDRGADLSIRVLLPGHYERPEEMVEATPLGYALRFPGDSGETVTLLRQRGGME